MNFVAIGPRSYIKRIGQNPSPEPVLTVVCVGDDVLDHPIWSTAPRQVWNDCKRARRNKLLRSLRYDDSGEAASKQLRPNAPRGRCLQPCFVRMKMPVKV